MVVRQQGVVVMFLMMKYSVDGRHCCDSNNLNGVGWFLWKPSMMGAVGSGKTLLSVSHGPPGEEYDEGNLSGWC